MSSLRAKLVGLYALILAAVIGAFSVLLVFRHRGALESAVDAELRTRAHTIGTLLEFENGAWGVEPKPEVVADYAADRGLYYQVADAGGGPIESSPLARQILPELPAADAEFRHGGRHFRCVVLSVSKRPDPDEPAAPGSATQAMRVVCGKDIAAVDFSVEALVRQLALIGPLVLAVSLAGGWLLARNALRPIDAIARTAAEIQASDLSRRVDIRGSDELARLAATLNGMFDRLQEAFDRQRRFTADASHELRTPLAVIAGNVELALKQPRPAEEYREHLADIQDASRRMTSIVEGLLTLARADAAAAPLRRDRVPLGPIVEEIVRLTRPMADEKKITVSVEPAGEAVVTGDGERLKELIANLITNAIRYNRPGGSVRIGIGSPGGPVRLTVEDTGIGIPAEDLPHIFERFYRVDKARSRELGGSGLGLAIAKWIVDAHSGEISVTSRPGEGARFTVVLPQ